MHKGFSLVELSIVLVILGLLVGGILAGQSLIRASELRAITAEFSRYQTAAQAFRDKYMALPGDMSNATNFWGAQDSTPATCQTISSTGQATCDGDGDGYVAGTASTSYERFRFWQHLANTGLVEGTFSGVASNNTSSGYGAIVSNSPTSKLSGALWYATYYNYVSSTSTWFGGTIGKGMYIGAPISNLGPAKSILQGAEAWNIDTKMDNGQPGTGLVRAINRSVCTDATVVGDATAAYQLSGTTAICAIAFVNVF